MLRELHIRNLALIEDAEIAFTAGLNVFTGATGAGKSLVLGALELLLGGRPSVQMVRPAAREARVTGVFQLLDTEVRRRIAGRLGREESAEEELIISRKIAA